MSIYFNYLEFCICHDEKSFIALEKDIKFIILNKMNTVKHQNKEDIYQDIIFKVFQKIKEHAFVLEDLSEYFALMKQQKIINNKKISDCLENFLKYQPNKEDYLLYIENKKTNFEHNFTMFIGSGRLRNYLSKIASQMIFDYITKNKVSCISLNAINEKGIEYIDTIPSEMTSQSMFIYDIEILTKEEKHILYLFFGHAPQLTQEEIGRKLKMSQQVISIKKNKILKKLRIYLEQHGYK